MHEYQIDMENRFRRMDAQRIREQNELRREALGEPRQWTIRLPNIRHFFTKLMAKPVQPRTTQEIRQLRHS
jgi:hypothetical protein